MKACKIYIDKNHLAERLGIEIDKFAIGEVKSDHSSIEFTMFIDENAITNMEKGTTSVGNDCLDIRRNRLL